MKPKWILAISIAVLSIISASILAFTVYYFPAETNIPRDFLFSLTFEIWGIIATILVVQKLLDIRDNQRWQAVNRYVFGFLYLGVWAFLEELFGIFNVKIEVGVSPTVKKFGIEYMNPEHYTALKQELRKKLKEVTDGESTAIKKNMQKWNPTTHEKFSKCLEDFYDRIKKLLEDYPHQIPPEFLSAIIDVRERTRGLKNQSEMLSDTEFFKEKGVNYDRFHSSFINPESQDVHDLFIKLSKLLNLLDKNVGKEWK